MPGAGASGAAASRRPRAEPDLACDVASLGCVYLGGFTFAQLARSLRVRGIARWRNRARRCDVPHRSRSVVSRDISEHRHDRTPPDRLSTDPTARTTTQRLLERGIGIRFAGQEKTNVEEYCVSEGWIRVAAGKALDRKGKPLTIKLKGPVEPYFRDQTS